MLLRKNFIVIEILAESDDWRVITVIDEKNMEKCTLKILTKTEGISKNQIIS